MQMTLCFSHVLPPIAASFALAADAAGVPYVGQASRDAETPLDGLGEEGGRTRGEGGGGDNVRTSEPGVRRLPLPRQLQQCFDGIFPTAAHTCEVWEKCSMVVGMHPDEATEPILDLCLAAGKAFAIIPCCVFPGFNPSR